MPPFLCSTSACALHRRSAITQAHVHCCIALPRKRDVTRPRCRIETIEFALRMRTLNKVRRGGGGGGRERRRERRREGDEGEKERENEGEMEGGRG